MKHNIRQRQLDPNTGLIVTKIVKVEGELGSGILDKNGREIFEGDVILIRLEGNDTVATDEVKFIKGEFWFDGYDLTLEQAAYDCELEVVGHVDD